MTTEEIGPTGKTKNCTVWADYEPPTSLEPTAKLCNGGEFEGRNWYPCASKFDCRDATYAARTPQPANRHHLPVVQPSSWVDRANAIAAPAAQTRVPTSNPSALTSALAGRPLGPSPARPPEPQYTVPLHSAPGAALPVVPPAAYPAAMQAPHVYHPQHASIGVTPTFLPLEGENVWGRLGKNIGQGMIGSFGYQIASLANAVDFFGKK